MKRVLTMLLLCAMLLGTAACGSSETSAAKTVDMNALYQTMLETSPNMSPLDEETMMNFLGIDAADCTQAITAISTNGMITDEIWLIEAKDADALARIQELAEIRMQAKADETISYAPDQYAVVEKGQILTNGNYLAFLVAPEVDTLKAAFEAAFQ